MISKVVMTRRAQDHLRKFIGYIRKQFKNEQAAKAVMADAKETRNALLLVAESLSYCPDPELAALGYKTIHFKKHRYFFVFEIRCGTVIIEAVYHDLQDYENAFKSDVLGR